MDTVVVCGMSHKTSPVEERERLSIGGKEALSALTAIPSVSECVIVSTCNRVEIYAAGENGARCLDDLCEFVHGASGISDGLYFFEGTDAARHLYRVSAGLDSMVVGEAQILGQIRRAYETALEAEATGPMLNKLFQKAFVATKKIKKETGIGSHTASVSSVAIKLARNIFGDIANCSVMVVGTGEAASEAATQLARRGVRDIRIAARNMKEAANLAAEIGGRSIGIAEIGLWIRKTDMVISATGSSNYILKFEDMADAMKLRKNEPISVIDIAVPRDIEPTVRNIEGVFLYDMDDLMNFVEKDRDILRRNLKKAEDMARDESEKFFAWREGVKAFPLIVELKRRAESVAREEALKTVSKLNSLGDDDTKENREKLILQLADTLTGKFLHEPVTKLKRETAASPGTSEYAETVRALFGLPEDSGSSADEDKDRKQG